MKVIDVKNLLPRGNRCVLIIEGADGNALATGEAHEIPEVYDSFTVEELYPTTIGSGFDWKEALVVGV